MSLDPGRSGSEEVAERTWVAVDRARTEAIVAADLQDAQLLRELGARLVPPNA